MFWSISMILANVRLRKVRFENSWNSSVSQQFRSTILKFDWLFLFGFPRKLSITFDIQIGLKMKHP